MSLNVLSPWDALRWFQTPRQTLVAPGVGSIVVAPTEVSRVALLLSCCNGIAFWDVSIDQRLVASTGIRLTGGAPPLILTHAEHGPLVQQAWFGVAPGGAQNLLVIEVLLGQWPQVDPREAHRG